MRDFYQEIIDIIGSGGEDCCVFPFGDSKFENAAHTTFVTKGQGALDNLTCTYSKDRTTFDLPTIVYRNRFQAVSQPLDGIDEEADTPDIAAFSRDDEGGANGFSLGAQINVVDATTSALLSKWETSGSNREWLWRLNAGNDLELIQRDESAAVDASRTSDVVIPENLDMFISTTYDGSGGASAMDGTTHYVNGAVRASTATNNASYVGMEAGTGPLEIGKFNAGNAFFDGRLGTLLFTHRVLSAAEMLNLNDIYVAMQRADRSRLLAGVI